MQRGSYIDTLGPKYMLCRYMDPLGLGYPKRDDNFDNHPYVSLDEETMADATAAVLEYRQPCRTNHKVVQG